MSGSFAAGFVAPFATPLLLLALVGAGLWSGRIGSRAAWLVPGAALAGLAAGVVSRGLALALPHTGLAPGIALLLLGALAAAGFALPRLFSALIAAAIFIYLGHAGLAGPDRDAAGWAGFAAGALLACAGGIGLAAMIVDALSHRALPAAGAMIALAGAATLAGVWP